MELTTNKRKGLIATILIHAIVFLIMLQWMLRTDKVMADDEASLTVTFATSASSSGGSSASSAPAAEAPPQETEQQTQAETQSQPTPAPVRAETTTAENAPEVKASEQQAPVKKKTLDPEAAKRMAGWGTKGSSRTKSTENGDGNDGDNNNSGGGGNTIGTGKDGWSGEGLNGFNISGSGSSHGDFSQEGVVYLKVCVDKNGNIYSNEIDYLKPNKSPSPELIELAKKKARQYKFIPKAGTTEGGCGTFKVTFDFDIR